MLYAVTPLTLHEGILGKGLQDQALEVPPGKSGTYRGLIIMAGLDETVKESIARRVYRVTISDANE